MPRRARILPLIVSGIAGLVFAFPEGKSPPDPRNSMAARIQTPYRSHTGFIQVSYSFIQFHTGFIQKPISGADVGNGARIAVLVFAFPGGNPPRAPPFPWSCTYRTHTLTIQLHTDAIQQMPLFGHTKLLQNHTISYRFLPISVWFLYESVCFCMAAVCGPV